MAPRINLFTVAPTPSDDADLTRVAVRARDGDAPSRNHLFATLAGPIKVAVQRHQRYCRGLEADEITSESFLALADLLAYWPDVPFAAFFDAAYGYCLRRRFAASAWPEPRCRPLQPLDDERACINSARALTMIDELCELPTATRWLVEHWTAGARPADLAPLLGWSPREVQRRWKAMVGRLGAIGTAMSDEQ